MPRSLALAIVAAALAVAGCDEATVGRGAAGAPATKQEPRGGPALDALRELEVKGRAPKTGYDRDAFGGDWASVDGCDTANRILARDLAGVEAAGCIVEAGTLDDPYTGKRIRFVRGGESEVDVDHVVALGDAWQKGAQQWSAQRRLRFANDPLNLLATDAAANRRKGDGDAATWLPPSKAFRCDYVARQVAVKHRYGAWVTRAEAEAMARVLSRCPGVRLPTAPRPRIRAAGPFESCAQARAAGAAPLRRGDGVYEASAHLDGDGDGVACE